ncbi:MAG: extracellular solute-binding protein [Clostridiales bacterium]|nr:extracellular solute-binding protein [Clostridiales bacterium]
MTKSTGFRMLFVLLAVSFLLPVAGCRKVKSSFPSVEVSATETTETTVVPSEGDSTTYTLTVASPLSYEACVYLAKLYVLKTQGNLPEGINGENITFDYLDSIDLPFALNVYTTSETGCNADTLSRWQADGNMPDIFLTDSFDAVMEAGYASPLDRYISSEKLLAPNIVYPEMLRQFYIENDHYGIPYQAAAHVLFCDMEVLNKAEITELSFKQDQDSFKKLLAKLASVNSEEQQIIPLYQAQTLIPYLPITFYGSQYLSASIAVVRDRKAFKDSLSYLKGLVSSGYTYESLDQEQVQQMFQGLSPLLSRKVGIWTGSTDEISRYDVYMPNTLSIMQIPSMEEEKYSPAMLSVYPLCVSSTSQHPSEASKFATFMALDEDALLLTSRQIKREGFLPCISSSYVWKTIVSTQKYGVYLSQFQNLVSEAVFIPSITSSTKYSDDLFYIATHLDTLIVEKKEEQEETQTT